MTQKEVLDKVVFQSQLRGLSKQGNTEFILFQCKTIPAI